MDSKMCRILRNDFLVAANFWWIGLLVFAFIGSLHFDEISHKFSLSLNTSWAADDAKIVEPISCSEFVLSEVSSDVNRLLGLILLKLNSANSPEAIAQFVEPILKSKEVMNPFSGHDLLSDVQLAKATDLFLSQLTLLDWEVLKTNLQKIIKQTSGEMNHIAETDEITSKTVGFDPQVFSELKVIGLHSQRPAFITTPTGEVYIWVHGKVNMPSGDSIESANQIYKYDKETGELVFKSTLIEADNQLQTPIQGKFYPDSTANKDGHALGFVQGPGGVRLVNFDLSNGATKELHSFSSVQNSKLSPPQFFHISESEVLVYVLNRYGSSGDSVIFAQVNPLTGEVSILRSFKSLYGVPFQKATHDQNGNTYWLKFEKNSKRKFTIYTHQKGRQDVQISTLSGAETEYFENNFTSIHPTVSGQWLTSLFDDHNHMLSFYRIDPQNNEISKFSSVSFPSDTQKVLETYFFESEDGSLYARTHYKDREFKGRIAFFTFNDQTREFELFSDFSLESNSTSVKEYLQRDLVFSEGLLGRQLLLRTALDGKHEIFEVLSETKMPLMKARDKFKIRAGVFDRFSLVTLDNGDVLILGVSDTKKISITRARMGN